MSKAILLSYAKSAEKELPFKCYLLVSQQSVAAQLCAAGWVLLCGASWLAVLGRELASVGWGRCSSSEMEPIKAGCVHEPLPPAESGTVAPRCSVLTRWKGALCCRGFSTSITRPSTSARWVLMVLMALIGSA